MRNKDKFTYKSDLGLEVVSKNNLLVGTEQEQALETLSKAFDQGKISEETFLEALSKSKKDYSKLKRKKKLAVRDGKPYITTVYVKTGEEKEVSSKHDPIKLKEKLSEMIDSLSLMQGDYVKISTPRKNQEGVIAGFFVNKDGHTFIRLLQKDGSVRYDKINSLVDIKKTTSSDEESKASDDRTKKPFRDRYHSTVEDHTIHVSGSSSLGGSSDAKLISFTDGLKVVQKEPRRGLPSGDGPMQLLTETRVDSVYRLLGANAPESMMSDTTKVAEFIPGLRAYVSLPNADKQKFREEASKHFVLDAVLGNWDVVGQSGDNMLYKEGKVYRIDNGGSIFFRAKGSRKPESWKTEPVYEIESMRDSSINPQAAEIFKDITDEEILRQVNELSSNWGKIATRFTSEEAEALKTRFKGLKSRLTDKETTSKKPSPTEKLREGMPSLVTQKYFDEGWEDLRFDAKYNDTLKRGIKKHILEIEKNNQKEYEHYARKREMTVEEYKQFMQDAVEKVIEKSKGFIQVHSGAGHRDSVADKILESGRFKSLFETGTGSGSTSTSARGNAEYEYFDYGYGSHDKSLGLPEDQRPVYGFFTNNDKGVINEKGTIPPESRVEQYGDVSFKVKDEKFRSKATITFTDSLGPSHSIAATPAQKPHFTSITPNSFESNFNHIQKYLKGESSTPHDWSYVEAQYHGQVTLDDIERINIPDTGTDKVNIALNSILKGTAKAKRHIPIEIFK